jgi:hypothetical protein
METFFTPCAKKNIFVGYCRFCNRVFLTGLWLPLFKLLLSSYVCQFTFDSDVRCAITLYFFCTEDIGPQAVTYIPKAPVHKSETFYYKRGASQVT